MPLLLLLACTGSHPVDSGVASPPEDLTSCFFDATCPYRLGVAHRGASREAPENTLAAIDVAHDAGIHAVELDVRTTADGVLVVMHDGSVDRTTSGSGDVSEMTLAEIEALVVPSEFEGVPDQHVPTFLEALEHARGLLVVDVDVKSASAVDLAADIEAADMVGRVFLLTKSLAAGEAYREANPDIAIMPNVDSPGDLEAYLHLEPELAEVDAMDLDEAPALLETWGVRLFTHALGFEVVAVENGTAETTWRGFLDDGAQVFQTDFARELVPVLAAMNQEIAATQ